MDKKTDLSPNHILPKNGSDFVHLPLSEERAPILLIEDDAARASRRSENPACLCIRLHHVYVETPSGESASAELLASRPYFAELATPKLNSNDYASTRVQAAVAMIDDSAVQFRHAIVVANSAYGCRPDFLHSVLQRAFSFTVELLPSTLVVSLPALDVDNSEEIFVRADRLIGNSTWEITEVEHPHTKRSISYAIIDLGKVQLKRKVLLENGVFYAIEGRLFALREGAIDGTATKFVFSSLGDVNSSQLIKSVGWTRWIKPLVRNRKTAQTFLQKQSRSDANDTLTTGEEISGSESNVQKSTQRHHNRVKLRLNIALAKQQDEKVVWKSHADNVYHRTLIKEAAMLNVAELFAGAGGMGLGFLMAAQPEARYRILFSGEIHPIYAETLRLNHGLLPLAADVNRGSRVPEEVKCCDLSQQRVIDSAAEQMEKRDLHLLIGGPPCQGFSCANRNTGYSGNPSNRLVEVFLRYVERLKPRIFLMENVQGILWTPKEGGNESPMVVDDLAHRMERAGYLVFPKLLDASWFGVPQHRSRFFLLGIHRDMGYRADDFGPWGPFPHPTHGPGTNQPYVTVGEAFRGLPRIGNGHTLAEMVCKTLDSQAQNSDFLQMMRAGAPTGVISDHVTSKHQEYVLKRYAKIPQGGNWEDIRDEMTNYADVTRTHSNIYRRLRLDEPSITLGHYRKAMTIHPTHHRGLSLREAARLQSFPDWFRFVGRVEQGKQGGLSHKQQQLANAVCPLMLKAIAEHLMTL